METFVVLVAAGICAFLVGNPPRIVLGELFQHGLGHGMPDKAVCAPHTMVMDGETRVITFKGVQYPIHVQIRKDDAIVTINETNVRVPINTNL